MSDLWFNVRFGAFHLQCKKYSLTKWNLSHNSYWANWKWLKEPFDICEFEWKGWKNENKHWT